MTVPDSVVFADTYAAARQQFLDAAAQAGGAIEHHEHPSAKGPDGGALFLDAVRFGPLEAGRLLVMLAGTHGSEARAISPLFCVALRNGQFDGLPPDTAVLLVHGVNPYGFAHLSRTNENHVDLNRNFVDFSQPLPSNPGYAELHDDLCVVPGTPAAAAAAQRVQQWRERHGQDAFMAAVFNGQYHFPDGLLFGGREREWSNLTLESVIRQHVRGASRVAFIDWHTGLGEYGQPFFLCFNEPGSAEREQCRQWWGHEQVEHQAGFGGGRRPSYSGLVFQGVEGFVAPAAFAGAVVEFGTTPPDATLEGLQLDRHLHLQGSSLSPDERLRLQARALESFCPAEASWRAGVMQAGQRIIEQTLAGLAAWDEEHGAHHAHD